MKLVCVSNRGKEKLNETSALHARIVLQYSAWAACRSVCKGGWAPGAAHYVVIGCGFEGAGLVLDMGSQWEVGGCTCLLRGCLLKGP